nr:zinc finger, CCHC-type [Tanacetum cinerariifolium]
MGDANPIRTLGDYSKTSHEGYRNTIELPEGNNMVPLRSDTIRLVQTNAHSTDFGSISILEDLTTRFLAQFFPPKKNAKLCNDILMFQQHQGESLSEAWTRFKELLQKVPHHGIDLWLQVQIFYDATRRTIDQSAGRKLRDRNAKESWALLRTSPSMTTKYCIENPEQAFVEYASSCTDEARGMVSNFMASQDARLSKFEADFKQQQSEMTNKIDTVLKAITDRVAGALPSDTVKNSKLNVNSTSPVLSVRSYPTVDP